MNLDAHMFHERQELHEQYLDAVAAATNDIDNGDNNNNLLDHTRGPSPSSQPSIKTDTHKEHLPPFSANRAVMSFYELYETKTRYYIVGTDQSKQRYRVLQIHRTNPKDLVVIEDDVVYTEQEKTKLLNMIEDGNLSVGGLHLVPMRIYGIIGFIRFTQGWYMIFITKRKQVALLGGHYVYHIDETQLVPIGLQVKVDKNSDEGRYIATFQNIDLTKNFYFSYTYDITNTLQVNMTRTPDLKNSTTTSEKSQDSNANDMFVWNDYLLKAGFKNINTRSGWILRLIYGFVDQAKISIFGRSIIVTLIARRSRHFAGARFLKRGVNDKGFVANDVETEQIVAELSTTSFHSHDRLYGNPHYTSYVQHRGSIPLIWSQDTTNMSPKPPIELNVVDPFFSAAALHFENVFQRYGTPCIALNLIKQKEKTKRESVLGEEFAEAIAYLNQFLPDDKKIKYIAWDMSRASKSHDQDVIRFLEQIAQETMESTGFFHSGSKFDKTSTTGSSLSSPQSLQHGVLRTNCIDCLDRTNAAQFLMGKCALGHQLYALGIVTSPYIEFDSDVINIFTEMYHDHGDTIALQYGGSHLVNTMETYRKINQWTSHPRDMIESIRRFYANAFSDADKQDAINLFLGNFVTKDGQPMLWELNSDYHLHNQDPRIKPIRRDYRNWCSPSVLSSKKTDTNADSFYIPVECRIPADRPEEGDPYKGHWEEYYNHHQYTTLDQLFVFNMNGTLKYRPPKISMYSRDGKKELTRAEAKELSPFTVRTTSANGRRVSGINTQSKVDNDIVDGETTYKEKSIRTLENIINASLDPTVNPTETKEYRRYTQQYRSIEKLTATNSDNYGNVDNFPEYQQYLSYIHRNHLDDHPSAIKTQSIDEEMFKTYVHMPKRAASAELGHHRGWTDHLRKRYEGYGIYLKTGRFPQNQDHPRLLLKADSFVSTLSNSNLDY
ncbi:polyphosphoinositide phosphatase [Halteromyces radiatus]|uniref:polyphosphoinositide phosphatase n=1 Tax=Halteromyces radiatus TaxID=101107 RepID=UPI00221EECA7|nr:polyphosphoinositide phosphatase [Halteromyces radiatus]KAI8086042.1 polyphosphoinositide phosphatase [Halteromyces radiatus]